MDWLDEAKSTCEWLPSQADADRYVRNAREVLFAYFNRIGSRLVGVTRPAQPSVHIYEAEVDDDIIHLAKRNIPDNVGELLIAQIGQTLSQPTDRAAEVLVNWSLAYIGLSILNKDPLLQQIQLTRLRSKIFLLDTDFILDAVVTELPISSVYHVLLMMLVNAGCQVIIPASCIGECARHALVARRTYSHFGPKLMGLTEQAVEQQVFNVFVKGFYYSNRHGRGTSDEFNRYMQNYFERSNPERFFREVTEAVLPSGVEISPLQDIRKQEIPKLEFMRLKQELLHRLLSSKKAEYRTEEENETLASTDAELYMTAVLNSQEGQYERILGGQCYIVTGSRQFSIAAESVGLRHEVSTRPALLASLLSLTGSAAFSPTDLLRLFENPFMIHAVNRSWPDIQGMIDHGLSLQGKSLARLRCDFDQELHSCITKLQEVELSDADGREWAAPFGELWDKSRSRGYQPLRELEQLGAEVQWAKKEAALAKTESIELQQRLDEMEKVIQTFGKRKQAYLRRIATRQISRS